MKLYRIRFRRPAISAQVLTFPVRALTRETAEAMARACWGCDITILPTD